MQLALVAVNPAGEITMLARSAFGIVLLLCLGIPVISGAWSYLRTGPHSDGSIDLDELWALYRQGEISWDEYLRGKVEGTRGLIGTKAQPSSEAASNEVSS
jgi:hypothetical protein